MLVRIAPGQITLTRMSQRANSCAAIFPKTYCPPLDVEYVEYPAALNSRVPFTDAVMTIDPPPAARRCGITCLTVKNVPVRFVERVAFHSSSVISSMGHC